MTAHVPAPAPAPADRRDGSEIRTIREAVTAFRDKRGPWVIAAAIVLALVVRPALGPPGWVDVGAASYILVAYPFGEWAIHVHLLHLRPVDFRGRRVELGPCPGTPRPPRGSPVDPPSTSCRSRRSPSWCSPCRPPPARRRRARDLRRAVGGRAAVTMLVTGFLMVGVYEWTHFLIHTATDPGRAFYRSIWRNHRLHHYKNEHYWHGSPTRSQTGSSARARTRPRSPGRRRREPSTASRSPSVRAEHVDENG